MPLSLFISAIIMGMATVELEGRRTPPTIEPQYFKIIFTNIKNTN
jgi:hypothetical protein